MRIDYTIKFTPQNAIPVNGKITYTFPSGYVLDNVLYVIKIRHAVLFMD